jgi:hypothetical protein
MSNKNEEKPKKPKRVKVVMTCLHCGLNEDKTLGSVIYTNNRTRKKAYMHLTCADTYDGQEAMTKLSAAVGVVADKLADDRAPEHQDD